MAFQIKPGCNPLKTLVKLDSPGDWEDYQQMQLAASGQSQASATFKGPAAYPCLVAATYDQACSRWVCCFVYNSDARFLLAGQGGNSLDVKVTESMVDFSKSTIANVLAIVKILVDTGIIKKADYEKRYLSSLSAVDQMAEEDRRACLARAAGK